MRIPLSIIAFLLPVLAFGDVQPYSSELTPGERVALLTYARSEWAGQLVEARGSSFWDEEARRWVYVGRVYARPFIAESGICKSYIYIYEANATTKEALNWSKGIPTLQYMVWLAAGQRCEGDPSMKIHLLSPIEEQTLLDVLRSSVHLAEQAVLWIRANEPELLKFASTEHNQLRSIAIDEVPEGREFRLQLSYAGRGGKGLAVVLQRRSESLTVVSVGLPAAP